MNIKHWTPDIRHQTRRCTLYASNSTIEDCQITKHFSPGTRYWTLYTRHRSLYTRHVSLYTRYCPLNNTVDIVTKHRKEEKIARHMQNLLLWLKLNLGCRPQHSTGPIRRDTFFVYRETFDMVWKGREGLTMCDISSKKNLILRTLQINVNYSILFVCNEHR